jgi:hypothetical protein
MLTFVQHAAKQFGYRPDQFIFTDYASLESQSVFDLPWRTIRGGKEAEVKLIG